MDQKNSGSEHFSGGVWLNVNCILSVDFMLDLVDFSQASGEVELTATISLFLKAKWLTKASHSQVVQLIVVVVINRETV